LFHKWCAPDRIYQIHKNFDGVHPHDPNRFKNWQEEYENSGAMIRVLEPSEFTNESLFDESKLDEFGGFFFGSTMAYMFIDAVEAGFTHITLSGIELRCGYEYQSQVPSMILNIDWCRKYGVEVDAPAEPSWRSTDWSKLESVNLWYGYGAQELKVDISRLAKTHCLKTLKEL